MVTLIISVLVAIATGLLGAWIGIAIATRRARMTPRRTTVEMSQMSRRVTELETERARMAAILSGMVEGVLVVDGEGRLRLVNDAARRMLNLESDLVGRHYVEAVRQPGVVRQLGAALRGEQGAPIEVPLGAAEAPRIFRAQATPATASGGAVLVLHDISDLRCIDRVRRDFVGNVSHELRTPLTAVRGYVDALLEDSAESDQRKKFLEVIDRHTARMERLVRDLLRLARLDALQERVELRPIEPASLFHSVSSDPSERIDRKRIQVDVRIDSAAETIEADTTKM